MVCCCVTDKDECWLLEGPRDGVFDFELGSEVRSVSKTGRRRMTSWKEVADEIRDAGGDYIDEPVVEDRQFVTARKPGDMPLQMARIFQRLANSAQESLKDE